MYRVNLDLPGRYFFWLYSSMIWAVMINFSRSQWRFIVIKFLPDMGTGIKSTDLIAYFSA